MVDNVALLLMLQDKKSGKKICVANIHVNANWTRPDLQATQIGQCIHAIEQFCETQRTKNEKEGIPTIFCGDFNVQPDTSPYNLISKGKVSENYGVQWPQLSRIGGKYWQHKTKLQSAYRVLLGDEPAFSNHAGGFIGTLDYIWFSEQHMKVKSVLEHVPVELISSNYVGCPNVQFPSDHLSCKAIFELYK